jgi:hypothetical protein
MNAKTIGVGLVALGMISVAVMASYRKVDSSVETQNPTFTAHVPPQCAKMAMEMTHGKEQVVMQAADFYLFRRKMENCFADAKRGSIEQGVK